MVAANGAAALHLRHLQKRYGRLTAVADVSVEIPRGQFVAVIGRSGAGKSTLLRLINRLTDPTAGSVTAFGTDVTALRGRALRRWRAKSAMIFQHFNLSPRLDVLTNVLIGLLTEVPHRRSLPGLFSRAERLRAIALLDELGLAEKAFERAERLSGGQQQRVAIARALMQEPEIMLADEPVAALDPNNAAAVMDLLRAINRSRGITMLCNLHSLDLARRYADRAIGMRDGRLVFDGSARALTAHAAQEIYGGLAPTDDLHEPEIARTAEAVA
jgi:phosphonate transport system ATP-binding protein